MAKTERALRAADFLTGAFAFAVALTGAFAFAFALTGAFAFAFAGAFFGAFDVSFFMSWIPFGKG